MTYWHSRTALVVTFVVVSWSVPALACLSSLLWARWGPVILLFARPTIHDQAVLSGRCLAVALISAAVGGIVVEAAKSVVVGQRRPYYVLAAYEAILVADIFATLARPWLYCIPFWLAGAEIPYRVLDIRPAYLPWVSGVAAALAIAAVRGGARPTESQPHSRASAAV